MNYDFTQFKKRGEEVKDWLKKEYASIHTGRATPTLLDGVTIDVYGAKTPIAHAASVTTEDARTLRISPWDKGQAKAMEKAIMVADLGVSVSVDDAGLRVSFPELTAERRTSLAKIVKNKLEDAKISLRAEREKILDDIKEKEKNGEMSEDDKFRDKESLQKIVDALNDQLEEISERKEKEIIG